MSNYPKWVVSNPNRQTKLIELFLRSKGFCVFGHKNCLIPEHHYEVFIEGLIKDWIADDRSQAIAEAKAEGKSLHNLGERLSPLRGKFSSISKDIFYEHRPLFYLEGLGISGLTFKPIAKVKLSSSYMRLYVELGDSLQPLSKNKKRKALRYGKPLPQTIQEQVNDICNLAIRHYLNNQRKDKATS